jgi:hypothetical protein
MTRLAWAVASVAVTLSVLARALVQVRRAAPPNAEPEWWSEFERSFAAYAASQPAAESRERE